MVLLEKYFFSFSHGLIDGWSGPFYVCYSSNRPVARLCVSAAFVCLKIFQDNFTIVSSRSPQNVKSDHFMLLFCIVRRRNLQNCTDFARAVSLYGAPLFRAGLLKLPMATKSTLLTSKDN